MTEPLDLDAIQARLDATGPVARQEFPEAISDITALVAEIHRLRTDLAGMTDLRDRAIAKQDTIRAELEQTRQQINAKTTA